MARFARSRSAADFERLACAALPFLDRCAAAVRARFASAPPADELVQETLLDLYRYAGSFRPRVPHAFEAWAGRILRNAAVRHCRRAAGRRPLPVDPSELEQRRAPGGEPLLRLIDAEERRLLRGRFSLLLAMLLAAYLELTPLQRRVLHLVEIEGLSYLQVARRLGTTREAVKMVVYRARRAIVRRLARAAAG